MASGVVSLSTLLDSLLQKSYHELTVLAELYVPSWALCGLEPLLCVVVYLDKPAVRCAEQRSASAADSILFVL